MIRKKSFLYLSFFKKKIIKGLVMSIVLRRLKKFPRDAEKLLIGPKKKRKTFSEN